MEDKKEQLRMLFLVNADESLEGLEFQGYKLLIANENWLSHWLPSNEIEWLKTRERGNIKEQWFILCKLEENEPSLYSIVKKFNTALHICNHTNIYMSFTVLGRRRNNIVSGPAGDGFPDILGFYNINDEHDIIIKDELQIFLNKYNIENFIPTLNTALDFFYLCLRTDNISLRFVLLISILEILFIPNGVNNELGYRASRNAAVFLGKSPGESNEIFNKIKDFYNYRSKYIHSGKSENITNETLFKLSEYVRQILKKMIIDKEFINNKDTYTKRLNQSAFGDNPYHIE